MESRTAAGMLFQTAGAETAKECLWKSEKVWLRCKTVEAPERNALDDTADDGVVPVMGKS